MFQNLSTASRIEIDNGMATSTVLAGDETSTAESPLLNDVVRGSVAFNGLPAKRSKSGSWNSASFIIGVEVAERFAYYGISSNLISYMTGPLRQSTATAAENVNAWNGTSLLLPLFGAFIADSFLGRYRTIIIASLLYVAGLGFLSLSAALHSWNSSRCKRIDATDSSCSPPLVEVMVFFISLYIVAFAQGGHKPCVQAFGADQFDEEDIEECRAQSSFFNWWYFSMNIGILVAMSVVTYIQENLSWELGFGIPCILMCFALFVFLLGSRTYRFRVNNGKNPFVRIGSVFVRAARNWRVLPMVVSSQVESQQCQPGEGTKFKYCRCHCNRFLDKALLASNSTDEDGNACSIHDVEDAKVVLRFFPIWCACLGYGIAVSQVPTLFTKQGATMDRYVAHGLQIPAASLQVLTCLSILVFVPIYDLILIPIARAATKKPAGISMLQRIGIGIFLSLISMVISAIVEKKRLETAAEHGLMDKATATVPMSVWWLAPQYILVGIAEVFTTVGLQEFFYDQIPNELKSIGLALYLSIFGAGSFLSSLLISVTEYATSGHGKDSWFSNNLNRAHLDYFYLLLASIITVTMVSYAYFAKSYIYNRKGNV